MTNIETYDARDVCRDFMHKRCMKGDACKFIHDTNICFHWWKNGSCKFGTACKKMHVQRNARKPKNTECFEPMQRPVDLHIVIDQGTWIDKCTTKVTSRDVVLAPNLFADFAPGELYKALVDEVHTCGIPPERLFKMWHGNETIEGTHVIADDKTRWKETCPTFDMVIKRLCDFFDMESKATRFNWYKDTSQWKPFHHDAAALDPEKAKAQNFTVAVSFGATREAAFEHAISKTVISMPQPDGYTYAFSKDTNVIWRHGILQDMPQRNEGRISVICWGYIPYMLDV